MTRLMRFASATTHCPAIEDRFSASTPELAALARDWFAQVRASGDDVRELLHDGYATACVEGAAFAHVRAFTSHVNVGFFQGMALPDPAGLLEGTGKRMRHVKLRPGVVVDAKALKALIRAAYRDMQQRVEGER